MSSFLGSILKSKVITLHAQNGHDHYASNFQHVANGGGCGNVIPNLV